VFIVYEATCFGPYRAISGLLKNQVCKLWVHAGIPTMFTVGFLSSISNSCLDKNYKLR